MKASSITRDGILPFVKMSVKSFYVRIFENIKITGWCGNCKTNLLVVCRSSSVCDKAYGYNAICQFHNKPYPNTSGKGKSKPNCPKHICSKIRNEIESWCRVNSWHLSWGNTDATKWTGPEQSDICAWEIAKCYIPISELECIDDISTTSLRAILNLMRNCSFYKTLLKKKGMTSLKKVCVTLLRVFFDVMKFRKYQML